MKKSQIKNRIVSSILALLMVFSTFPMMLTSVYAADVDNICGLVEHTHTEECAYTGCVLDEHIHNEECTPEFVSKTDVSRSDVPVLMSNPVPMADNSQLSINAVWDYGTDDDDENIPFGSTDTATIDHDINYESETVQVRIKVGFPESAKNKKFTVTLAPGLVWSHNGASAIPQSSLESVSDLQNQSTVYGSKLGDGSYTYNLTDGVSIVEVDLLVKKSFMTNFASISDAITVEAECSSDGGKISKSTSLTTLMPKQEPGSSISVNNLSVYTKPDETVYIVGGAIVLHTYRSATASHHARLYDYAEYSVTAPSDIELVTAANAHPGGGVNTSAISGWTLKSKTVVGDRTTYIFRKDNFSATAIGITPEWIIPSASYGADDKAVVTVSGFEWKVYGDENIYSSNKSATLTYIVVDANKRNEIINAKPYNHSLQYSPVSPDAVYQLTGWYLDNTGADASMPKVIEFEFDTENIGVTDVTVLVPKGKTIDKIWYKLKGDTQWTEKSITTKAGSSTLSSTLISNVGIGLEEDDYFAAFKYELDYVDDNGTPDDTTDDIRYGIPSGAKSSGSSGVYTPIAGVNLALDSNNKTAKSYVRVYDKVEDGQEIVNDTGKRELATTFSTTFYNYLQVDNTAKKSASAGTMMTMSSVIRAYWTGSTSFPFCVGFANYPILYIRDETGTGISNVKLVNSDGVDILAEYSDYVSVVLDHTETVDYNGDTKYAKVYRIDTTPLSTLPDKEDRYAAAVGFFEPTGKDRRLTLTYNVTTPSTYSDSQAIHYMADAVFFSNPAITTAQNRNNYTTFSDAYDVNGDSQTTGTLVLTPKLSHTTGYYIILSRADISVALSAKKVTDSKYTAWDGSSAYIQAEPGEEYDIKAAVFNGSGFPTSTEINKITYVYIPIPKEGEEWGKLNSGYDSEGNETSRFTYTTKLISQISNPDPSVFTIEYGNVDTSKFGESTDVSSIGAAIRNGSTQWGSYSENANCVRIAISGMPSTEDSFDFVLPLVADKNTAANDEVNIFSAVYFEDITDDQGRRYTGWMSSDKMALQIALGSISGRVWVDLDGDGIRDSGEPGMENVKVTAVNITDNTAVNTTTSADGSYSFSNLGAGKYSIRFADDRFSGYVCSPIDVGSNDRVDSEGTILTENNGVMTAAQISAFDIPFDDNMGGLSYDAFYMDVGLTPYINVVHQWKGDIPDDVELPENQKLAAGGAYTSPETDNVTGYTFKGWYTDEACTTEYEDCSVLTEDTVLYGKWDINSYTITFNTAGGNDIDPITLEYKAAVNAPADPQKTGYTFVGWDKEIPAAMPAENITITAKWKINQYDVTYVCGSGPETAVLPEKDTVDFNTAYTAKIPAEVNGFTFDRWYTDSACTQPYVNGTAVTEDITLYGKWERDVISVEGSINWVENGEGFKRPDNVLVNLYRNGDKIDSYVVAKDESLSKQIFEFTDLWEYDETGRKKYIYTVEQNEVPSDYVETQSGFEIVNTYNVDKYYIKVEWDHTGAPESDKVTQATVVLYRDDTAYQKADLSDIKPIGTTTVPRVQAKGHTFRIEQNPISGYNTAYTVTDTVDTDNDGEIDAVYYTVKNTYIMPKIAVGGTVAWDKIPAGESAPDLTVNLIHDGTVVSTTVIPSGSYTYSFDNLDRYTDKGDVKNYTIEVQQPENYKVTLSDRSTDADGNITVDIDCEGEFTYSTLTVTNEVTGEDVPDDDEFEFTITVGNGKSESSNAAVYQYTGSHSGTITANEPTKIVLKGGEWITISDLLVGAGYTVEQKEHPDYETSPSQRKFSGTVAESGENADFVNNYKTPPTGNLSVTTVVTGTAADVETVFEYRITFDSNKSYEYAAGDVNGTIASGDIITLKHGQTATVYKLPEGIQYTVEQVSSLGYKTSSTGDSGKITAEPNIASFVNEKNIVAGSGSSPQTGDSPSNEFAARLVLQIAILVMLFCLWQLDRRDKEKEFLNS